VPDGLRALQERFFALITAPEGVAAGLRALGTTPAELAGSFVGDERLDAAGRLDVYANMYFHRLLDVLRADFPRLARMLGDADFNDLVTDYLLACPSRDPSLRHLGGRLPGFLAGHPLAAQRPWLAELARLEWARVEVVDRSDAPVLRRAELARLEPAAFAGLPLVAIAAHALVDAEHAVDELWRGGDGAPAAGRRRVLVWRRDVAVYHRVADEPEATLLAALSPGTTFGALCEALAVRRGPDEAAALGAALLARWVEDELLVDTLA
jgi:hypothetical protein